MSAVDLLASLIQQPGEVRLSQPLADLPGWDSLKMVKLVVELEGRLGRQLKDSELEAIETVADVERLLGGS